MIVRKRRAFEGRRLIGALVAIGVSAASFTTLAATPAISQTSLAGSSGVDTGLSPTPSAMTLPGRGRFSSLAVTVNQTANLAHQAISVSWTGAPPGTSLSSNFMQIFQCWGDDDGTVPENPGPPPEQCQFGAEAVVSDVTKKIPAGVRPSLVYTRAISQQSWGAPYFDPTAGFFDPRTPYVWKPFRTVDGKVIDAQKVPITPSCTGCLNVGWQNPYFDFVTSNEKPWARNYGNGNGSDLFQVQTGLESPGLGCGQKKEPKPDGTTAVPKCWLVLVPRGTPQEENPASLSTYNYVVTSPLSPTAWANRIAFPLSFNPVDSPCVLGADEQRIVGNELAIEAVSSWQPKLCSTPGAPPYAYSSVADQQARQQLISGSAAAPGLAVMSRPFDPDVIDPADPVVYAPLTLSGLVIGFNIERVPTDAQGNTVDPAEVEIAATRVTTINLTPRLVAKLLTQSYSVPFYGNRPAGYEWLASQPLDITTDPDFWQFNPEFAVMTVGSRRTTSALTVAATNSDAAFAVWQWILADPEAKGWLDGTPDAWGMKVNPLYTTTAAQNPTGQPFAEPIPNSFPKNDPYCYQDPGLDAVVPRPLCLLDIQPYGSSFADTSLTTRAANDGARTSHDPFSGSQQSANTWWGADGPQPLGARSIMSITDSASAFRYGLQTARLSRAGDNGTNRTFIAADTRGLEAGLASMVPERDTGVLVPSPTAVAPDAYPLTLLSYAASFPKELDESSRTAYADFLKFATGDGQSPGLEFGQLPPGYAPLSPALKAQAAATEAHVRAGTVPEPETAETTSTTATTRSTTTTTTTAITTKTTSTTIAGAPTTTPTTSNGALVLVTAPPAAGTTLGLSPEAAASEEAAATAGEEAPTAEAAASPSALSPAAVSPGLTPAVAVSRLARWGALLLLFVALGSGAAALILDEDLRRKLERMLRTGVMPRPPRTPTPT